MDGATLENVDWRDTTRTDEEFEGCTFVSGQLSGARLVRCRFIDCRFDGCDLSNAVIQGSSFRDTAFVRSKLMGVDWTAAAALAHLSFEECQLAYAIFAGLDLRKLKLVDCNLRDADFTKANLTDADCRRSDFAGARFARTNLAKADLRGALRYAIDPVENTLKKAKFSQPEVLALLERFDVVIDE